MVDFFFLVFCLNVARQSFPMSGLTTGPLVGLRRFWTWFLTDTIHSPVVGEKKYFYRSVIIWLGSLIFKRDHIPIVLNPPSFNSEEFKRVLKFHKGSHCKITLKHTKNSSHVHRHDLQTMGRDVGVLNLCHSPKYLGPKGNGGATAIDLALWCIFFYPILDLSPRGIFHAASPFSLSGWPFRQGRA